jgi:NDP-sugar pyrophosphorylase family protein
MKAFILSAGKSTRILPVSKGLPKPLIEIGNQSVLKRNIAWLHKAGFREIWINLHYRPEEIQEHLGDGSELGVQIHYVFEPEILGTAGAVKNLESEWRETFLLIYGDNLFQFSIVRFLKFHREQKCLATVALFDREKQLHTGVAGGQVVLSGPYIHGFVEGSSDRISPYVNAGAYLLEPEITKYIEPNTFYDFGKELFPKLINDNVKIAGHVIDGYCLGIDTPESYHSAISIIEKTK